MFSFLCVPCGWIIVGRRRVSGWVVPAAALCHITASQCEKQGESEGTETERERNMKGDGGYEKREKLENREVDQRGAEDKREMRHTKTLVCNQVTGAVRIVVVFRQLPQTSKSALRCLTHMHAYVISDTTQTTEILLPPLSYERITLFMSLCAKELHISSY